MTPGNMREKWPWRNLCPSPREMTKAGGLCELWARKIRKACGGRIVHVTPNHGRFPRTRFIGAVNMKTGELISAEFSDHYAVSIGDRIYDRITGPEGMPLEDYKTLFEYADDLIFEVM
jgi:hypothetical protein